MNEEPRYRLVDFLSDFAKETVTSAQAMSVPAKISFGFGFLGFLILEIFPIAPVPPATLTYLRVLCFTAFIIGAVANARAADEFYRSVHLYACAIALPISAILIYSTGVFDINLGRAIIAYIVLIWFVGFVYAFARLRQA